MDIRSLDSLTPAERTVLRTLLEERDQKAIARELNLSPETVKTHLRNAREKTGIRTSFALAKALEAHQPPPPERVIPLQEVGTSATLQTTPNPSRRPAAPDPMFDAFQEDRAVFHYDEPSGSLAAPQEKHGRGAGSETRLLIIACMVLVLTVIILLAFPLSESFQRLANLLDPPQT